MREAIVAMSAFSVVAVVGAVSLFSLASREHLTASAGVAAQEGAGAPLPTRLPAARANLLADLPLEAQAAIAIDATTGSVLGERNGEEPRPLASLTKIFTALAMARAPFTPREVTMELTLAQTNESAYAPSFVVNREEAASSSPAQPPLAPRVVRFPISTEHALELMMSASVNEAAEAIARAPWYETNGATEEERRARFLGAMNELARALGLASVSLQSPSGLDIDDRYPTALGSPHDVARAVRFLLAHEPTIAQATLKPSVSLTPPGHEPLIFFNTNPRAWRDVRVLFSKTGFTNSAGGNLALAVEFDATHRAVVVVMGSSREGRVRDAFAIVEALQRAWRSGTW